MIPDLARFTGLLLLLQILTGCSGGATAVKNPDPWEGVNRKIYIFNDNFDRYFMKPVAKGYQAITPYPVEKGVSNVYGNFDDFGTTFNDLFQLKLKHGLSDAGRFLINSTVGIVGIVDVASEMGLKKRNEDFGQTLGHWGVPSGPYIMIPFIGPSTMRDGPALFVDFYMAPQTYFVEQVDIRNMLWALKFINQRAELLGLDVVLDDVAYDRYVLLRDAYLSRRAYLINDGEPPKQQDDLSDELEMLEGL